MRRVVLVAAAFVAAIACGPKAPEPTRPLASPAAVKPRAQPVLVTIVVDQMAAWIADERWPELPPSGGLARLTREGTRARDMRYAHAVTDTAPGHSALYTGAFPRVSGIFANEIPSASTGAAVSVLADPEVTMVTASGAKGQGSSGARLRVETIADRLRAAHPDAAIVSISLKDRGAIFGGGRKPDAAIWYWPAGSQFVTSSAFGASLPAWATTIAKEPFALAKPAWDLLDPAWVKVHARSPDAEPGEGDYHGLGTTFPHPFTTSKDPGTAFRATPFSDAALLALAEAALVDARTKLAAKPAPLLLALSLSANDYIGHTFGPDSWEAWDQLLRLDTALGAFFGVLDRQFGPDGWAAMLAADHGVTPMPEVTTHPWCAKNANDRWGRTCGGARLLPGVLREELKQAAQKALGTGSFIAGLEDPYVYLTPDARALPPAERSKLDRAVKGVLTAHKEVAHVFDVRTIPATCPGPDDDSIPALVCRSFVPNGSAGDYYVVPTPGSYFDPTIVPTKGSSHGTPYVYDRSVPMVVRAPGRVARGVVIEGPIPFGAFARTASALLGIEPPAAASGAPDLTQSQSQVRSSP